MERHVRKRCWVPNCVNAKPKMASRTRLFKFPRNVERSSRWLEAIGEPSLTQIAPKFLSSHRFVCQDHFRPAHITPQGRTAYNAVPEIFVDNRPVLPKECLQQFLSNALAEKSSLSNMDIASGCASSSSCNDDTDASTSSTCMFEQHTNILEEHVHLLPLTVVETAPMAYYSVSNSNDRTIIMSTRLQLEYPLDQVASELEECSTAANESSSPSPLCITPLHDLVEAENQQVRVKQEPIVEEDVVTLPVILDVRSTEEPCMSRRHPDTLQKVNVKKEPIEEAASQHQYSNRKRRTSSRQPEPSSLSQALSCIKTEPRSVQSPEPSTSIVTSSNPRNSEYDAMHQFLSVLQKPVDEDQVFGEHVACELRSINNLRVKRRCKRMITEALLNAMKEECSE